MKTMNFSETIAASDLKGSMSRHLIIRYLSIEGQGQSPWPKVVYIQNSNWIFSETTVPI